MNVLMLGWEFPPVMNGGLGIACHGLTQELKNMVNLTLIIPQADPTSACANMQLIGLNTHQVRLELKEMWTKRIQSKDVYHTEHMLFPYKDADEIIIKQIESSETFYSKPAKESHETSSVSFENLYGNDVYQKVHEFASHTCMVAEKQNFDIIHAHDWMTFPAAVMLKEKFNKPLVLHVHSLETDRNGITSKGGAYDIEQKSMQKADAIIPVSNYTGDKIKKLYFIPESKIFPVHNGIEKANTYRKHRRLNEKVVLFLGRITFQKGPDYYFEVAKKVINSFPNVRFVMAGTGDKMKEVIESGAYSKISHKFHFTGFLTRNQVQEMLASSDVYFMPSVSEPFGLSAIEAAQFGVPCVISKQSGVAEVLRSSLKADFWDIDKLSDHIISLLRYDIMKDEMVKNAFKDIESVNWKDSSNKIMQVYNQIINN
ncbi:MAG: glycosyltransferase [Flavobacteriales bacterium]|nr:glycosyltransferase [Flavobacteriales bacterium]